MQNTVINVLIYALNLNEKNYNRVHIKKYLEKLFSKKYIHLFIPSKNLGCHIKG